jgi:uncharacterized membrane protein YdjX (TVP38/TMEM64 family)
MLPSNSAFSKTLELILGSKMKTSPKILPAVIFASVIVASVGLILAPELIHQLLLAIVKSFQAGGLPSLFAAMIMQALIIPIPSEFILICGGAAFGFLSGWLVGAVGSVAAALIGFYISRRGGRSAAQRFIGRKGITFADNWFNRWGAWAVLLGRIIPFIPFDVLSYSAGLTNMKFRRFIIPTIIGTLPRTFFYALLGDYFSVTLWELVQYYPDVPSELQSTIFMFNIVLFAIVITVASILIGYWFITQRYAPKQETKTI